MFKCLQGPRSYLCFREDTPSGQIMLYTDIKKTSSRASVPAASPIGPQRVQEGLPGPLHNIITLLAGSSLCSERRGHCPEHVVKH